jgi:hypothetical protein
VETLQQQRLPSIIHFNADVYGDKKYTPDDADNEADTLPNLEIIPFVAHDAIRTDKYEPYLSQPYDHGLEKDYFASVGGSDAAAGVVPAKEKPFRYNNKFIHHNYDDSLDYVYSNPHERIDSGPYYFENQFDSFSPPNEQDFLGKQISMTISFPKCLNLLTIDRLFRIISPSSLSINTCLCVRACVCVPIAIQ